METLKATSWVSGVLLKMATLSHKRPFSSIDSDSNSVMAVKDLNTLAVTLRGLHRPGRPLVLANVYDILSAQAVAPLPSCTALATASYAVARAAGTEDDDMTFEQNITAAHGIGKVAAQYNKPLTVDLQDGYGDRLIESVKACIDAGVVGINLEDCDKDTQKMHSIDIAVQRIKTGLKTAKALGVPDFVINARCDTLIHGGEMDEVIERGKAYLNAGAANVFVWGGSSRGVSRAEVERMVKEFKGRLNVALKWDGGLTVKELSQIGVARISVGPTIQFFAMDEYAAKAKELLAQAGA
jgi:2-methylisocitrate lyase-like PEP mutase family enzyme